MSPYSGGFGPQPALEHRRQCCLTPQVFRMFKFVWDDQKAASNLLKHGVSFDEAVSVFGGARALTFSDTHHSEFEGRSRTYGISNKTRLLTVVHTVSITACSWRSRMCSKFFATALAVFAGFAITGAGAQTSKPQADFLFVGSYHMGNPGRDVHNTKADDVLSTKAWYWYVQQAFQTQDRYLLQFATSKLALFGCRQILAHNCMLFPFHKWLTRVVAQAPSSPDHFLSQMNSMLQSPTPESTSNFFRSVNEFVPRIATEHHWSTHFILDSELNWMSGHTPVDDL